MTVLIFFKEKRRGQKRFMYVKDMRIDGDFLIIGYYKYRSGCEMPDFQYDQAAIVLDDIRKMVIT